VSTPNRQSGSAMPAPLPSTLAQLTDDAFLEVLYSHGPSSRAAVAKATGISKPTISESAQRLLADGIIIEVGQATGNRGRSPLLYDVNPDYGHVLGVALERGNVAVRALDSTGGLICEEQIEAGDEDLPTAIADARDLVTMCSQLAQSPRLATAISVAAPIDPRTHTVRQLPDAPFTGTVPAFREAFGLAAGESMLVDNDVNWATLAENRIGSMTAAADFLYVYLGAGVGSGLFLSGHPHRGAHGTAGEIAFLRMPNGDTLMRRLAHSPIGSDDGRSIDLQRARAVFNSATATPDTDDLLDDIAGAIVTVATIVDPDHVVLGGPLAETVRVAEDLTARIHRAAIAELDIAVSPLGRTAPLDGAAIAALEQARQRTNRVRTEGVDRARDGHRS
jgi:predicted NBD/HSP70 family sugar kinase/biotin operon repressor